MISFRTMERSDIDAGLSLCRAAKWNQLARDWEIFLQLSPGGCLVALNDEKIAGTVTTISYRDSFSWIGMVFVDPACRRQGIGTQLLKEALKILEHGETVKLDATPAGREVYLKLNFVDEYLLSRMNTIVSADILELTTARPVEKNDLAAIRKFDQSYFGGDRQQLLQWVWQGNPQYCFIIGEADDIQGYCMGRAGHDHIHIGPVVAENIEIAKKLLLAALKNCLGKSVIIDAMNFGPGWIMWLQSKGFSELRQLVRMYRGNNAFPGVPEKQFTILGPEFG